MTYESIINRWLSGMPPDIDRRENTPIWLAVAPMAAEMAQAYITMDAMIDLFFADTASGVYLERRTAEFGVNRKKAIGALRKGLFFNDENEPFDIPIGSRFFIDDLYFRATRRINKGQFALECEEKGIAGNRPTGELLALETIDGLAQAILDEVIIPGKAEETDDALYVRFLEKVREKAFAGNRADYRERMGALAGVGGMRLYRAPQGGGTVRGVIVDSEYKPPTEELVAFVQEQMDPTPYTGEGFGLAPICHMLTIEGAKAATIDLATSLTLSGASLGQVEPQVKKVFEDYLAEIRLQWPEKGATNTAALHQPLTVRVSQVEARILNIEGVQDIAETTLNGQSANIVLPDEVPMAGSVMIDG